MLRLEWLRMLTNPGHTAWPAASITSPAAFDPSGPGGPIHAIRSPAIPTSARTAVHSLSITNKFSARPVSWRRGSGPG
jgi:hypothetical protein